MTDTPDLSATQQALSRFACYIANAVIIARRDDKTAAIGLCANLADEVLPEAVALSTADTKEANLDPSQYSPDALGGANMRIDQLKAKLAAAEERIKELESLKINMEHANQLDAAHWTELRAERNQLQERLEQYQGFIESWKREEILWKEQEVALLERVREQRDFIETQRGIIERLQARQQEKENG